MKRVVIRAEGGEVIEVVVYDDEERKLPAESEVTLVQQWCQQEHDDRNSFLCYPDDGACSCGEFKHHVHCGHGFVIQTG